MKGKVGSSKGFVRGWTESVNGLDGAHFLDGVGEKNLYSALAPSKKKKKKIP